MNKRIFLTFAILCMPLLGNSRLYSAEAPTGGPSATMMYAKTASHDAVLNDLNDLISRINVKINQQKKSETDYADNIKEFDALMVKHKDAEVEDRVDIMMQKGKLYLQVLEDPEKALPVFQQIKTDFPSVQLNGDTDQFLAGLKMMAEKKKIRDILV